MDVCLGGDLHYQLTQSPGKAFSEYQARFYAASIIVCLEYMHSVNVIHRDIKPENLLLDSRGQLKVTDLGISQELVDGYCTSTSGTRPYMAPEIFMSGHKHSTGADIYSLGITVYQFLIGQRPYRPDSANMKTIVRMATFVPPEKYTDIAQIRRILISAQERKAPSSEFHYSKKLARFSWEARDFIQNCLICNPKYRLGSQGMYELLSHPWFHGINWNEMRRQEVPAPFIPDIRHANCAISNEDLQHIMLQEEAAAAALQEIPASEQAKFNGYNFRVRAKSHSSDRGERILRAPSYHSITDNQISSTKNRAGLASVYEPPRAAAGYLPPGDRALSPMGSSGRSQMRDRSKERGREREREKERERDRSRGRHSSERGRERGREHDDREKDSRRSHPQISPYTQYAGATHYSASGTPGSASSVGGSVSGAWENPSSPTAQGGGGGSVNQGQMLNPGGGPNPSVNHPASGPGTPSAGGPPASLSRAGHPPLPSPAAGPAPGTAGGNHRGSYVQSQAMPGYSPHAVISPHGMQASLTPQSHYPESMLQQAQAGAVHGSSNNSGSSGNPSAQYSNAPSSSSHGPPGQHASSGIPSTSLNSSTRRQSNLDITQDAAMKQKRFSKGNVVPPADHQVMMVHTHTHMNVPSTSKRHHPSEALSIHSPAYEYLAVPAGEPSLPHRPSAGSAVHVHIPSTPTGATSITSDPVASLRYARNSASSFFVPVPGTSGSASITIPDPLMDPQPSSSGPVFIPVTPQKSALSPQRKSSSGTALSQYPSSTAYAQMTPPYPVITSHHTIGVAGTPLLHTPTAAWSTMSPVTPIQSPLSKSGCLSQGLNDVTSPSIALTGIPRAVSVSASSLTPMASGRSNGSGLSLQGHSSLRDLSSETSRNGFAASPARCKSPASHSNAAAAHQPSPSFRAEISEARAPLSPLSKQDPSLPSQPQSVVSPKRSHPIQELSESGRSLIRTASMRENRDIDVDVLEQLDPTGTGTSPKLNTCLSILKNEHLRSAESFTLSTTNPNA